MSAQNSHSSINRKNEKQSSIWDRLTHSIFPSSAANMLIAQHPNSIALPIPTIHNLGRWSLPLFSSAPYRTALPPTCRSSADRWSLLAGRRHNAACPSASHRTALSLTCHSSADRWSLPAGRRHSAACPSASHRTALCPLPAVHQLTVGVC
jgi:hypothetical protein